MIELAEVIEELRRELSAAIAAAAGQDLYFEVGAVELEASVAVERSAEGGGKVRFWVLEAGAEAHAARTTAHRVKLTLDPRLRADGRRPQVSGGEVPGER